MPMNHNKKSLTPKLRFPEFTSDWIVTELRNLLDYERPENYIVSSEQYQQNGVPVLTANKSFVLGYTNEQDNIYTEFPVIIFDDFTTEKKYVDFAFKVKSSAIKILKPKGENNLKFIFELINTIKFEAKEYKRYYISTYQNFLVLIPKTLLEQQKIADCLASLDELISAENKKLDALKKHKQALMQNLFPARGKTMPSWRFAQFKNDNSWRMTGIGEVGTIVTGKTPSTTNASLWNGSIQFVTPTDIKENKYQYNTQRSVVKTSKMRILPKNTIMFTCIASIGKMALSVHPCITNQQINSIIPYSYYESEFLYYSLLQRTPLIKASLETTTVPIINKTDFSKLHIWITDNKQEQEKIAECLSTADQLIQVQTHKLETLKMHKKALMQGLFPTLEDIK